MTEDEIREKIENDSELLAYFDLNKNNNLARNLFYHEIPEKFVFSKGKWNNRKKHFSTIGRMVKVSPAETERYHLRLLLLNVKGATSYDDIRTIKGLDLNIETRYATFAEACLSSLIRDDEEWKKALEEANSFEMPWKMRELFAWSYLLKSLDIIDLNDLAEDFAKKHSIELAYRKAYLDIAKRIVEAGKSLDDFPTMEKIDDIDLDIEEKFDIVEELDIGRRSYELLNDEQRAIVDEIMNRISNPDGKVAFYFLSGPGGSGTTFVISKIVHLIRGMKKKVSTMAFTGIAATLLPGGRTMHNRFGLNLDMSNSKIGPSSKAWTELENIDMFICDEAPMIHKRALSTIDLKLKEIMKSNIDFGGKIMLMAGDFRQTLPIQNRDARKFFVSFRFRRFSWIFDDFRFVSCFV
uniref:ATP-dependent DNA helicase n=1 Tax=Meloidogyne enterolobii TaxID=390850 RepID=A0A6V7XI61_MELEN|nr:unnamed protein product [Meloidogyne enterolobii]